MSDQSDVSFRIGGPPQVVRTTVYDNFGLISKLRLGSSLIIVPTTVNLFLYLFNMRGITYISSSVGITERAKVIY